MPPETPPGTTALARLVRYAALVLAVVAVIVLVRLVLAAQPLAWVQRQLDALGPWGPPTFAAVFVLLTVLCLPATPVVLAAGALYGVALGGATMLVATTISATVSYFLARHVAHDRVAALVRTRPRLEAVWRALGEGEGWRIVVAVRLSHALPFGIQNLLFGVSPVRFRPYLVATFFAMIPGTLLYAYLGWLGAEAAQAGREAALGPLDWALRLAGLALFVGAVVYVARVASRALGRKAAEHPDASP